MSEMPPLRREFTNWDQIINTPFLPNGLSQAAQNLGSLLLKVSTGYNVLRHDTFEV